MTTRSLAFRLFAAATGWVIVVLVIAGLILASYYRRASEAGYDERLHVYLKTLVADLADAETPDKATLGALGEPRFDILLSGWYWQVTQIDKPKGLVISSRSLFDASLPRLDAADIQTKGGGFRASYVDGPDGTRLRAVERTIELGTDGRFLIVVAAPAGDIEMDVAEFVRALILTFILLGIGLVATTLLQVRFGLTPLNRMRETLAALRAGKAEKLPLNLPDEIEPLARELDALVDSNKQIVERARTHVGNLAHALKTPLSVIANEAQANAGPLADKVLSQTRVMRDQIEHHLQRARIAAAVSVVGTVTEARPVIEAITRTMEKVHRGKRFATHFHAPHDLRFRGEKQDLEEMLGNLVDNAGKWAVNSVSVSTGMQEVNGRPMLVVTIEDDGSGVPAERLPELGQRGRRLDETVPGTGLGLSIVADLVSLYGGAIRFESASAGGLKVVLTLPAVTA